MALEQENEIDLMTNKIKMAAREKGIDLGHPDNEHTLWCDLGTHMQYSGSYGADSHAAWSDGYRHPANLRVYVAHGPLQALGILEVVR
jgi:hypothetical protein